MDRLFSAKSFDLLKDLAANNNREWYQDHKAAFEAELLSPFAQTLELISGRLMAEEMDFSGGKKTMFRMNRDVRFSKDKSPYKTNVSGLLTPGGGKSEARGFVYLQLDQHGGFAAFGRYNLDAKALGPIRDRIVGNADRFQRILEGLHAQGLDIVRDGALRSMPRGFADHADHRFAEELKLTSMMVRLDLPSELWINGNVVGCVAEHALTCRPFIEFVSI